jgi:gamma-glutamylcyclotransferase (GGCT)/AIG2-like uncharacterized protein YtfP
MALHRTREGLHEIEAAAALRQARFAPRHLFVYGTLMSGFNNAHARLLRQRALSAPVPASVEGALVRLGCYPALVETEYARVCGELYEIGGQSPLLRALDLYEGCGPNSPKPHLYRRKVMEARLPSGRTRFAWVYVHAGTAAGHPLIQGGRFLPRA